MSQNRWSYLRTWLPNSMMGVDAELAGFPFPRNHLPISEEFKIVLRRRLVEAKANRDQPPGVRAPAARSQLEGGVAAEALSSRGLSPETVKAAFAQRSEAS